MARRVRVFLDKGPASISAGDVAVRKGKPVETDDPRVIQILEQTGLCRFVELEQPGPKPKDAPRNEPGPVEGEPALPHRAELPPEPPAESDTDQDDSDLPPPPPPVEDDMKAARKRQGKKKKATDLG